MTNMVTIKVQGYDDDNKPTIFNLDVLPCPFCGGKNLNLVNHCITDSWLVMGQITCNNCWSEGPAVYEERIKYSATDHLPTLARTKEKAIEAWNRRILK